MKTKYKLLNFDHGYDYPENFSIGSFTINITENHCRNLTLLPRDESITFGWDKDFNKKIKQNPKKRGGWIETAEAIIDDKNIKPSVIFPESSSKNSIDDLCLILSFISGRLVTLENNPFIDHLNPEVYEDKVVHYHYFSRNDFQWDNLSNIRNQGVAGQFYNLIMAYQNRDIVARAIHYNNALNQAYDNHKYSEYSKNKMKGIDRKSKKELKNIIEIYLNELDIKKEIKDDFIYNKFPDIVRASATIKLKYFLVDINLYPRDDSLYPNNCVHKRLTWLSKVRNSMAHEGMFPSDDKFSVDLLGDITSNIIELVLRINQYYFAKILLGINDPYLNYIKKQLVFPYFYEGSFGGEFIFNETHEEYMERAAMEWLSEDN